MLRGVKTQESEPGRLSEAATHRLCLAALMVGTLLLYAPLRHHDFVAYDDEHYVTANPLVTSGVTWDGIVEACTEGHFYLWHPLTSLSHMLDCQLFGQNPGPHHLVNLVLHTATGALLFVFLNSVTGARWRSFVVAGLFLWHPLRVESVAWASCRKDTLCALFWVLTFLAYARHARRSSRGSYAALIGVYALGIMTRPTIVTLPFVLLLLDIWPLRRIPEEWLTWRQWKTGWREAWGIWKPLVVEKLPLFGLSALLCALTVAVHDVDLPRQLTPWFRVESALVALASYLGLSFWPIELTFFYPFPEAWSGARVAASAFLLLAVTVWLARVERARAPLLVGWLWFLGVLAPVLGLVGNADHYLADRYTYIPHIGLFAGLVWGAWEQFKVSDTGRRFAPGLAGAALLACVGLTTFQLPFWKDSEALFRRSIEVLENNHEGHTNLAFALSQKGRLEEALPHFEEAMRLDPDNPGYAYNLAVAHEMKGDLPKAAYFLAQTADMSPDRADVRIKLGILLNAAGRANEAVSHLTRAAELEPGSFPARLQLGNALAQSGDYERAATEYQFALTLAPPTPELLTSLAAVHNAAGKHREASGGSGARFAAQSFFARRPLSPCRRPRRPWRHCRSPTRLPTSRKPRPPAGKGGPPDPDSAKAQRSVACPEPVEGVSRSVGQ